MAGLGKRRPARARSGVSGLSQPDQPAAGGASSPTPGANELTIQGLAHDGRGVSRQPGGKTVFVDDALDGERVRASVHVTRKRYDEAHVTEVLAASPVRVTPPCEHYAQCGGCDLQHLAVASQRQHKIDVLRELLARQKVSLPEEVTLLSGEAEGYRRRARLGVKVDSTGQVRMGFRARHSHRLVDLTSCVVMRPELASLLVPLREQLEALDAPRHVGHLELLATDGAVTLVVRQLREQHADMARWRAFAARHDIHLAVLLGRESPHWQWLTRAPRLSCQLSAGDPSLTLGLDPGDFLQANETVNQRMVDTLMEWLGPLIQGARVLDLFAGIGNFSLPLAARGGHVTAVEGNAAMVDRLAANARNNGLEVAARQADLGDATAVTKLLGDTRPDVLVLDPPRSGAETLCRQLARHPVPRVLYISCDPATLARDVALLVAAGYVIRCSAVADMFSHTSHLESMLLLECPDSLRQRQGASDHG
ncbi:RsmD family RNA methyltransferase [Halomonas sp. 18H]|uniref:RsmD family RNA methyltransferase n=1 Tax=Halomonas almeriensis TaxID=308163 RepID=UPI00222E33D4|nr:MULTISPECIES: RsmD family RNA methyltransferase [Halomonas]MCW4152847.1 RsmD family RNA methyltransferase [Halomonas sp. 18H]MDN3551887.1 RsmD family RNA methyltransferase [Halomonas almeriensis]